MTGTWSLTSSWIDGVGRQFASADCGTNGGATFTRPATVPTRSDTILVSTTSYNNDGEVFSMFDPQNTETRFEYDDAGRQIVQIENYVSGGTAADQNRTTWTAYTADGQVFTLTASNSDTGNQQTIYSYGTTLADSGIASSQILGNKKMPLAQEFLNATYRQADTCRSPVSYLSRSVGERCGVSPPVQSRLRDQRIHSATVLPSIHHFAILAQGNNGHASRRLTVGTARRLSTVYDSRGMVLTVTTWDDPRVGFGNVQNQVQNVYNDFGQQTHSYQAHSGSVNTSTSPKVQYGYDRASNRTWRKDGVLTGYDELYTYDGLYRLNDQKRGTLNGTQTAITSGTFEQQWGLDATGNWKTFKQDNDGNGTWELNQTRAANKANEITNVNNTTGTAWATPSYDTAGNMVGIPNAGVMTGTGSTPAWAPMTLAQWNPLTEAQWSAMTETTTSQPQQLSASYDAWNRLVLISNGTQKISEHVYDARGFRIRKDTYTSGTLTETRHYYYTPGWQCVEERTGSSTTAERQFVWGLRYIDDLVMRDRSTANNGVMNERRYAMQDGNWNTVAICDITGFVSERFEYSAYGTPVFMTGAGVVQSASTVGFETLYAGYRWDGTTPQMYYVRNRFLLPMIGTWNRRDPLGYVDGMNLYFINASISGVDPFGTAVFIGAGGTAKGIGGGMSVVSCCDENRRRHRFSYVKVCLPPTLIPVSRTSGPPLLPPALAGGTGASATIGIVFGMDGETCRAATYKGWFLEISGFYYVGGHVDIGFNSGQCFEPTFPNGVVECGGGIGTPGFGLVWCYYFLKNEVDLGSCDPQPQRCTRRRRTTSEEAEASLHKLANDYCWQRCQNDIYPPSCMERCIPEEVEYLGGKLAGSGPFLTVEECNSDCGS